MNLTVASRSLLTRLLVLMLLLQVVESAFSIHCDDVSLNKGHIVINGDHHAAGDNQGDSDFGSNSELDHCSYCGHAHSHIALISKTTAINFSPVFELRNNEETIYRSIFQETPIRPPRNA